MATKAAAASKQVTPTPKAAKRPGRAKAKDTAPPPADDAVASTEATVQVKPADDGSTFTFYADNGAERTVETARIVSVTVGKPIPDPGNPDLAMLPAVVQVRRSNGAIVAITSNESVASITARLDEIGCTEISTEVVATPKSKAKAEAAAKPAKAPKAPKNDRDAVRVELVEFIKAAVAADPNVKAYKVERTARSLGGLRFGPNQFKAAVEEAGVTFATGRARGEGSTIEATPEQLAELVAGHMKAKPGDDMFDLLAAATAAGFKRPAWNVMRAATMTVGIEVPTRKAGRSGGATPKAALHRALVEAYRRGQAAGPGEDTGAAAIAAADDILANLASFEAPEAAEVSAA